MSEPISINIKSSADKKYTVSIEPSSTITKLKEIIAEQADVPSDCQRLIYSGRVLKDSETVESYKIQSGHTIHLVKSAGAKAAAPTATAASTTTPANPSNSATSNTTPQIPQNIAAGQGSYNPLAGLTGARYAGLTQLPSASMFGPDGGMGALPDENTMAEMMDSPHFQQGIQQILSDPSMLDYMIQQSPQLREMGPQARQMLQSDYFRQMLSDPQAMRQMIGMQRAMGGLNSTASSFPAPGSIDGSNASGNTNSTTDNASGAAASNPFAALFPGGSLGGGAPNPFGFGNLLGAGMGVGAAAAPQDTRPPEERYESQLRQLNDMGFFDFDRNVQALRRSGGSVQGAVEYLLTSL